MSCSFTQESGAGCRSPGEALRTPLEPQGKRADETQAAWGLDGQHHHPFYAGFGEPSLPRSLAERRLPTATPDLSSDRRSLAPHLLFLLPQSRAPRGFHLGCSVAPARPAAAAERRPPGLGGSGRRRRRRVRISSRCAQRLPAERRRKPSVRRGPEPESPRCGKRNCGPRGR